MRITPLKVRLPLAAVYMVAAAQLGAAVDTIARLKDNDAHRQAYDDTVMAPYKKALREFELEVERQKQYPEKFAQTKEATEAILSMQEGTKITVVMPKITALGGGERPPLEAPKEPEPYIAPPEPEARNYFLRHGHNLGVFLHQWAKDQQQPTPDPS